MTPEEMEAKIERLCEEILQIQEQQEGQRKHWLRWSRIGLGVVFMIAGMLAIANQLGISGYVVIGWILIIAGFGYAIIAIRHEIAIRHQ